MIVDCREFSVPQTYRYNMEDNNIAPSSEPTDTQAECAKQSQESNAVCENTEATTQKPAVKTFHKNGRNRSAAKSNRKVAPAEVCGEVSDLSAFKEKLSGESPSGYADCKRPNREETAEDESQTSQEEPTREGPSFETEKFKPRAVEVPLTDRRIGKSKEKSDEGVVSYTSNVPQECPSLSLFTRIKNAIRSIFSGKKKNKKRKFHNHKGEWKNQRNGDFKKRRGNYNNKGKFQKNYHHRKRSQHNGNRNNCGDSAK